jgi:plasmid maintenance system killer protein
VTWAGRSMLAGHRLRRSRAERAVEIFFSNAKLAQTLNEEAQLTRAFDATTARQIRLRLAVLAASATLADVSVRPPDGRHQLKGNPEQHFAVYVGPDRRIVFEPTTPAPKTAHGRLDLRKVTAITILDIVPQA